MEEEPSQMEQLLLRMDQELLQTGELVSPLL